MSNFRELTSWLRQAGLEHLAIPLFNQGGIRDIESLRKSARCNQLDYLEYRDRIMLQQKLRVQVASSSSDIPEQSTAIVCTRKDAPVNKPATRGNLQKALDAAKPENRGPAVKRLLKDIYAPSNLGSRDSKWKTWCEIAQAWGHEPVPITTELAIHAATSFKEGTYRSARQYFHRAKEEHVDLTGQELPADVDRMVAKVLRSTERGIGPAAYKDSFLVELLRSSAGFDQVELATPSFLKDNTAAKVDMVILGCWWMTRGIEIGLAKQIHLWAESSQKTVFWTLPVDKTHTTGSCVTRPHKCCCTSKIDPICPFHAACRHITRLNCAFNIQAMDQKAAEELPLFPNADGQHLTKYEVTCIIREVIKLTGTALQRPGPLGEAKDRFGEHVMRVSGAQLMARANIELYIIQLYGRWGSWAIERYVQEAYLHGQQNVAKTVVENLAETIEQAAESTTKVIMDSTNAAHMSTDELMQLVEKTVHVAITNQRRYIGNPISDKAHLPAINEKCTQSTFWHAACGWPYGRRNHVGVERIIAPWTLCKKCVEAKAYYNQIDNEEEDI